MLQLSNGSDWITTPTALLVGFKISTHSLPPIIYCVNVLLCYITLLVRILFEAREFEMPKLLINFITYNYVYYAEFGKHNKSKKKKIKGCISKERN